MCLGVLVVSADSSNYHQVPMIPRLTGADENLQLLRNSFCRFPGTARILLTCGDGASPRPNQLLSGTLQISTSSHTGHLPRAIKLHRQHTSLDPGVASWDGGDAPSPHVSKRRAVPGSWPMSCAIAANFHSQWRAAGSWKLGGDYDEAVITTRTPRHQGTFSVLYCAEFGEILGLS